VLTEETDIQEILLVGSEHPVAENDKALELRSSFFLIDIATDSLPEVAADIRGSCKLVLKVLIAEEAGIFGIFAPVS
jgi:hypothetical protein